MDSVMASTYIAAVANIVLLGAILYPSAANYFKTKSLVSVLLIFFSVIFLVQNVVAIYFHATLTYMPPVEFEVMVLTVLQTLGFGALAWVTYR